jgi:hypothetical protein
MRTDLSQGFLDAVAIGDCDRYCVIYINGLPRYFAQTALDIDGEITAVPAVAKWGQKTVGTDLNASVNNISIPAVDRSVTLINSEDYGWLAREFARKTQEGKRIDFRIKANGEDVLEDSLVIKEPITYKQGDAEINISCVSAMVARDPLVGSFDATTQAYSSVSVGSIGNSVGSFREDLSDAYCKIKTTALSGTSAITADRNLVTAGFQPTGTIRVDYEDVAYTSISGTNSDIFNLSVSLLSTHLAGQSICIVDGLYYYDYGPGPVDVVGSLMVKGDDGAFAPYDGEYEIVNSSRLLLKFTSYLPHKRKTALTESSISKNWSASDFELIYSELTTSGSEFLWGNGYLPDSEVAAYLDVSLPTPAGASFVRGVTSVNVTPAGNNVTERKTFTQSKYAANLTRFYNSYVSGKYLYADDADHKLYYNDNPAFGRFDGFSLSAPAGSVFVSGSVRVYIYVGFKLDWGDGTGVWSYGYGSVGGVNRLFGSNVRPTDELIDKTYSCSSLSQINNTNITFWYFANKFISGNPPLATLPRQCVDVGVFTATGTFDVTTLNAVSGSFVVKIFNSTVSNNATRETSYEALYRQSRVTLKVRSGVRVPTNLKVGTVNSISSTLYYGAITPGFPQRVVYDASNTTVKIGEEGSDVNPVDLLSNLLLRKNNLIRIDDVAAQESKDFYAANSYLMNGYIDGSTRLNAAILEVMKESALMIFERAGNVVIKRRKLPVDATPDMIIPQGMHVKDSISISHQSDDDCTNRITIRYNADAALTYANTYSAESEESISRIGSREEVAIDFPHVDSQAFAEFSANYWLQRNTLPFRIVEKKLFGDFGQVVEYGDFVKFYTDFSKIGEVFGEVVQITVDYANSSSPTIYTITLTTSGTTDEPEYLIVDDESVFAYEYLNTHPLIEQDDEQVELGDSIAFQDLNIHENEAIAETVDVASASASQQDEVFIVNDQAELLQKTIEPDTMTLSEAVNLALTNAWGEFAWGEPGHYWSKTP